MQASGDTVTPMIIIISFVVVHMILSPILTQGWGVFPRLGVQGTALTFVISHSLGALFALWFLFTGRTRLQLSLSNFRLDLNIIWRIVKIGIPASVTTIQRSFSDLVFVWLISPFGTLSVAAHSLVQRLEMMLRLPSGAIGMAAGVLVGQNLGAGQPERAERNGWLAMGFAQVIMMAFSVVILIWAENIISIFTSEPGLVEVGAIFLRIATAGYLFMAVFFVLQRSLTGAGATLPAMLVSLGDLWVVRLPLAFLLPRVGNLGVLGVRWAMVAGVVAGAVAYIIYFGTGRWKRKTI